MGVKYEIPEILLKLDFNCMCLYEYATELYKYGQSIFEPIRCIIPKENYINFFIKHFENCETFISFVDFEFLEYTRVKILRLNGFPTASGYVHSKKEILFIDDWIL